jgi:hypothetical protein
MSMRGKAIIISAVTAVIFVTALVVAILSAQRGVVRAYSTDKRMTFCDAQYIPENGSQYNWGPASYRLHVRACDFLHKLGLKNLMAAPAPTLAIQVDGPQLLVIVRVRGISRQGVELLSERGECMDVAMASDFGSADRDMYLLIFSLLTTSFEGWGIEHPLTNGTFRLRIAGETNDIAVLKVR